MPMPELPDTGVPNGGPAPVESLPAPKMEAMGAAFQNGLGRTLGISLEGSVIGKLRGGAFVPYDDAKAEMEAEGYDSHVLPKAGLSRGELDTIISQQSKLKQNDAIVSQSHLSGFTAGAMGFAGGSLDPLFIGAGPVLGRLGLAAKGLTLPGRLAAGGAEGAVIGGTYDVGLQHFGNAPGDRDIGTDQVVKDSAFMALGGAVLHGAFGPRAARPTDIAPLMDMVRTAENTAGAAKHLGIPENEVVSKAGAVGTFQVTPNTAKQYGFNPSMLKDPAYNRQVAEHIVTDLTKRFGNDAEAIAIGYNAGPGWAKKFIAAGRDRSILPKETQAYLKRIDVAGIVPREAFGRAEPIEDTAAHALAASSVDAKPTTLDVPVPDASVPIERPSLEPGSVLTSPRVNDPVAPADASPTAKPTLANQGPTVEAALSTDHADLKASADAAVAEAKARPAPEGADQHPVDAHLEAAEESLHNQGYSDDMVKAIGAAVRCTLVNGLG